MPQNQTEVQRSDVFMQRGDVFGYTVAHLLAELTKLVERNPEAAGARVTLGRESTVIEAGEPWDGIADIETDADGRGMRLVLDGL